MNYKVKLFAMLKQKVGDSEWAYYSDGPMEASGLLAAFFEEFPELGSLRSVTRLAVNQAFVEGDPELGEDDEIALIPPVSGG